MSFTPLVRSLGHAPILGQWLTQLDEQPLQLKGLTRLAKGLVTSALAQQAERSLLVIAATLEEAGRWSVQLEAMGWSAVSFYPTSEASPYEPFETEAEITWGQFQILADLLQSKTGTAIVATERALQPHLPPPQVFRSFCLTLEPGQEMTLKTLGQQLARLGYERVSLVESEGQWSQRGDIVDIFPVASEWPVRLEWFGNELERMREFDPASQRSQDSIPQLILTPTGYGPILQPALLDQADQLPQGIQDQLAQEEAPEGLRRLAGIAFEQVVGLSAYLHPQPIGRR